MQQSIVKFVVLSYKHCSTCFGHYYAHHQEPLQTAVAASGFRMNTEVDVFPAVVGLLVGRHCLPTNKPTTVSPLTNRPRVSSRDRFVSGKTLSPY
jgi:hypothetical protein